MVLTDAVSNIYIGICTELEAILEPRPQELESNKISLERHAQMLSSQSLSRLFEHSFASTMCYFQGR